MTRPFSQILKYLLCDIILSMSKYLLSEKVNELLIEKSRFITLLFPVESINDIESILTNLREQYPKATHHCYGYLLANQSVQKYNDDGEPNKTAGFPILDVLLKNDLDDVLAVVIRYFGGIKLGAGGLTRAYRKSVAECLKIAEIIEKVEVSLYEVTIDYHLNDKVNYLLQNQAIVTNINYQERINYQFYTYKPEVINTLKELIGSETIDIIGHIKVEKR